MGRSQRAKGHRFERMVAAKARILGLLAKRGLQSRGGQDEPDVCLEGGVIECKARAGQYSMPSAIDALVRLKNENKEKKFYALAVKLDYKMPVVMMSLDDWLAMIRDVSQPSLKPPAREEKPMTGTGHA